MLIWFALYLSISYKKWFTIAFKWNGYLTGVKVHMSHGCVWPYPSQEDHGRKTDTTQGVYRGMSFYGIQIMGDNRIAKQVAKHSRVYRNMV